MDQLHSFLTQRIFRTLLFFFIGLFIMLYGYNFYRSKTILSQPETYLETTLTPTSTPDKAKKDQLVSLAWKVESPVPRIAQKVGLLTSSISTPSAIPFTVSPSELAYTDNNKPFAMGDFSLPYEFKMTIKAPEKDVYYRFYALVDGRYLYSPEFKLSID